MRKFNFGLWAMLCCATTSFAQTTVGDDYIAIEAESTQSPLGTNWVITTEGGTGDDHVAGLPKASGGKYIETTTGNVGGTGAVGGKDMLQYKFTPKTSGTYTLTGRMAQNLSLVTEAKKWDKCNDILVKMEGDYTSSATPVAYLQAWNKYYGRGYANNLPKWGSFVKLDVHVNGKDTKFNATYNLTAGKEYTLSISARSKGLIIDYFLLKKSVAGLAENVDIATLFPTAAPGGSIGEPAKPTAQTYTYKASDFKVLTSAAGTEIAAGDFITAKLDWKDKTWLSIVDRLKWGAAETTYKGGDGKVNVAINTILEKDGESTFKVYINNVLVGEVTNESIFTSADQNDTYTVKKQQLTTEPIAIKEGDKIRVEFNSATNGKVPEGNTTATSRGRWASVVLEGETLEGSGTTTPSIPTGENMLDNAIFAFENTGAWNLWTVGGPFFWEYNSGADVETYGSTSLKFEADPSVEYTPDVQFKNINISDATGLNGFKFTTTDQLNLIFDIKMIKEGANINFLCKNLEGASPLDIAAVYGIVLPTTPADGKWQTVTMPIVAAAKAEAGVTYNIDQILLTSNLGLATDATYKQGSFLIDNIRILPVGASSAIESATATTFAATAVANTIVVNSDQAQVVNVYTISGTLVASLAVEEGTTTVASDLAKGIYIVNNTKVVVK